MIKKILVPLITSSLLFATLLLPQNTSADYIRAEIVCQIDTAEAMISYVRASSGRMYKVVDSYEGGMTQVRVTDSEAYGACSV